MVRQRLWKRTSVYDWLAAVCLFLLAREWLLPLPVLTDTGTLSTFYLVVASVLLLDLLLKSRGAAIFLKLAAVLWLIHYGYFVTPFFGLEWLQEIYLRLVHDLPLVFQQNWAEMSPITRNLLFNLTLVVLISLVSYLVIEQRQGLWFVFLTEAYLATLDTFMPYEADGAVVRGLVIGFFLLAVSHLAAVTHQSKAAGSGRFYARALLVPLMVIAFTVGVAYGAPKQAPNWPDPVPFLIGNGGDGIAGTAKKTGYDPFDQQLGGPFVQDDSLVFVATTNQMQYWRGDAKDTYTGKGWEKSKSSYKVIPQANDYIWEDLLFSGLETEEVRARLRFEDGQFFSHVFYPGQLKQLTELVPSRTTIFHDTVHQYLETRERTGRGSGQTGRQEGAIPTVPVEMRQYNLIADVPVIHEDKLRSAGQAYPGEIADRYLQLPEELPSRVRQLAAQITQSAANPYDKVRAVEAYLRYSGRYRYETKDVPVTRPNQDFVDQFLFESMRGYCDHFSTSMVVLLRSAGVPARWVKGFATGTQIGQTEQGELIVEVRNRDAHSWVEVYFPGYGWIPFEATVSFTSPLRVYNESMETSENQPAVPASQQQNVQPEQEQPETQEGEAGFGGQQGAMAGNGWKFLMSGTVIAGAAVWLLRRPISVWWLRRRVAACGEHQFGDKYGTFVRLCERLLNPRGPGETLREYVKRLKLSGDSKRELFDVTRLYERVRYGHKPMDKAEKERAREVLDRLSRQLKS